MSKQYQGERTIDGLRVTVNGEPLPDHSDVKTYTNYGFEWSYEGESPQQLALAILFDFVGDKDKAIRLSEPFMKLVIADLDNDWVLTGTQVDKALKELREG